MTIVRLRSLPRVLRGAGAADAGVGMKQRVYRWLFRLLDRLGGWLFPADQPILLLCIACGCVISDDGDDWADECPFCCAAKSVRRLETDRETDGRWIAEIPDVPGVMAYGETQEEAIRKVQELAATVADQGRPA
jgi:hypothetical protein